MQDEVIRKRTTTTGGRFHERAREGGRLPRVAAVPARRLAVRDEIEADLVELGISMRHLDSASVRFARGRRLAAGVSGLIYYFHIYFLRLLLFSLVHLVFLNLHDAVYFLRLTVHLPPSPFTCFIFLFRGLARRPSSCPVYLCDRSLE